MEHTHFHNDHTEIVPERAAGYSPRGDGFRINMTTLDMIGDGGVFTTVEDLLRWDRHFYDNRLGGDDLLEKQHTVGILNDGTRLSYAAGLTVSNYQGLRMVSHGGSFVGFRADMIRFPEQRFSVICLANLSTINPSRLARQVADIYLEEEMEPVPRTGSGGGQRPTPNPGERETPELPRLTDELIARYRGAYYSPELNVIYELVPGEEEERGQSEVVAAVATTEGTEEGLLLRVAGRRIGPITLRSDDVLVGFGLTFNMLRDSRGAVTGIRLDAGRVRNLRFERRE
jgi:hypothetical protein